MNISIFARPTKDLHCKTSPPKSQQPLLRSFSSTTHLTLIYMRINSAKSILSQKAHCVKRHQIASFSRIRRQLLNPETAPTTSMSLEVFFLERQEVFLNPWLWVSYYTLEDFVVLFICPVFSPLRAIKAYVTCEWAEHSPSIICLKNQAYLHHNLKTNPRLQATTMKTAQLWCIRVFSCLPHLLKHLFSLPWM